MENKEFMNLKEVAEYLGVYRDTVYRYLKDVERPLPSMRISKKKILVKKSDLEKWLEEFKK